jgi:hypothetical protein
MGPAAGRLALADRPARNELVNLLDLRVTVQDGSRTPELRIAGVPPLSNTSHIPDRESSSIEA